MQPSLIIKQGTGSAQAMQPGMVAVPMTISSNMAGSIPNMMTLNKAVGQNMLVTSQNLGAGQPSGLLPNVQIMNMGPGVQGVAAQKSVAAVSPRVVLGAPQVVGTRPAAPGHPGMAAPSSSLAAPAFAPCAALAPAPQPQQYFQPQPPAPVAGPAYVKPSDNTKEKCRNFLANLLDLSSKEPPSVEMNVRNLIQELIDAQVEPEQFCDRLEKLLNASPQPCLIGFLKKSLPLLRQSLVAKELVIDGINPPAPYVAFSNIPPPSPHIVMATSSQQIKPATKPGNTISVLQNIPVHSKVNMNKASSGKGTSGSKSSMQRGAPSGPSNVLTPGKSLLKDKERKSSGQFTSQQYSEDKMAGDDDINDVAAMGGVNLAEETQRILGSTEMIGTQIRSCKEDYLVSMGVLQARVKAIVASNGLEEPSLDVACLLSHAVHERLKTVVEKLAVIAQHRIDHVIKTDPRYEVTQDVKGQLKFLEELDRVDKKRREDSEREILLRAAKSRSKNEDPEQAKLKAKAKEMQRAEMEELRQREANLTALQAIGSRKKPRLEGPGDTPTAAASPAGSSANVAGRSQMALRTRLKRINQRDMLYLLETDRDTAHSLLLYKSYLK